MLPPVARHGRVVTLLMCGLFLSPAAAFAQDAEEGPRYQQTIPQVKMTRVFPKLHFRRPIWLTHAGDDSARLFVVEQAGKIHHFQNKPDVEATRLFLDLESKVYSVFSGGHNEEGMLALAFHPDYRRNGHCYVYYNAASPRRSVISRFTVAKDDPDKLDPATEKIILEVEQPFGNHKGCCMIFGPDGYLYLSLGDGGAAYDPYYHGQNLATLLGTVLRIDINKEEGGKAYAVPADNPFVGREGARPEIYAYGLRNIWRMSFDRHTGLLYGGDVGQDKLEEIDIISKGGNYGWNIREGSLPVAEKQIQKMRDRAKITTPKPEGISAPGEMIEPIAEYGRSDGMSVTGGYVYRGTRLKSLQGVYIYADYVTGRFWGLKYEDGKVVANNVILRQPKNISSFGEGPDGEVYILTDEGPQAGLYILVDP